MKEYISLHNFIKLGGNPEKGMKLIVNPPFVNSNDLVRAAGSDYHRMYKEYTFVEIVEGKGVVVLEKNDKFLGTGWLYTLQELILA